MGVSRNGSDPSLRGYRAATDALDERPSAATRAAILAAAARQVQAAPRDAREPIAAPRVTPRKRWPYAAAAAVLLSSLAVMMATRTEREMPTFTAPTERVAENAVPSRPVPSPEPPQPAAAPPASQEIASTKIAAAKPEKQAKADSSSAGATIAAGEAKVAPAAEARAKEEVAVLRDAPAPAAAPAPSASAEAATAAMPAQLAKRQAAPAGEATERRRNESADMASAERSILPPVPAAPPAAGLGAATGTVRAEADVSKPSSASEWLERIIKLRRAGRHEEADVELKRFRESYPQVTIPTDALPATGTR
jgi:hypothetical protein